MFGFQSDGNMWLCHLLIAAVVSTLTKVVQSNLLRIFGNSDILNSENVLCYS